MSLNKRTLILWRKQALLIVHELDGWDSEAEQTESRRVGALQILQLTQALLDRIYLDEICAVQYATGQQTKGGKDE